MINQEEKTEEQEVQALQQAVTRMSEKEYLFFSQNNSIIGELVRINATLEKLIPFK
jgi:hypothetical protein